MKRNSKISAAVAAILSAPMPVIVIAADTSSSADTGALQEITVTAERRSENIQNVPISIQALTAETLQQLSVTTFDDYVKYVPNVTQASWGPGQSLIFMRGLSTGALGIQGSGTDANFPNVAVYLDEQSAMMPYRNLDIYAADLERIEVLEGPQGTLFGAGAQAGAIRYITNKPKLDVTEGYVNAGYGDTAHGGNNSQADATLNLPLIPGTLAARAVVYVDSRGGYINNVPGTFTRQPTDLGIDPAAGGAFPSAKGCLTPAGALYPSCQNVINNNSTVANEINPVTYQGIRASVLWKINEKWDFLIAQTYQDMNAQGVFYQEPLSTDGVPLPPLSVTTFNPAYTRDSFENTAWTLNGQLGDIRAVYTGGYLVRHVQQQADYTAYSRGNYADYYQCTSNKDGPQTPAPHPLCYSPSAYWRNTQRNTHLSNELRFSTPDDWRLRGLLGGYWENFQVYDNTDWFYKSLPACESASQTGCMTNIQPAPGSTANVPGIRPDNESFLDDVQRGYKQYAFFASADFDLIPHTLTLTAGTRYYNFNNTQTGSNVFSFGCYDGGAPPCAKEDANNLNALNLKSNYSGFISRGNLTWHVTNDAMAYYTYSEGFRPGGFNRGGGPYLSGNYIQPQQFAPDKLTNNELGWKTEWLGHHLLVNGAIYQEDWKNTQQQFFDPSAGLGNLSFVVNGANYRVRGLELQVVANVVTGLSIQAGAAWNSSEQTNSPALLGNVPGTPYFGKPLPIPANPYGPVGSPLPQSPPFMASGRIRYEWTYNNYTPFVQAGFSYTAHSQSLPGNYPPIASAPGGDTNFASFNQPGYTTYDASLGVSKDNWTVQVVGQNITNVIGAVFISANQGIETQTVNRPRVIMLRMSWNFPTSK
jgi:iron complex outermembrane recepter protein